MNVLRETLKVKEKLTAGLKSGFWTNCNYDNADSLLHHQYQLILTCAFPSVNCQNYYYYFIEISPRFAFLLLVEKCTVQIRKQCSEFANCGQLNSVQRTGLSTNTR
jgi:hypothetical protein